MIHLKSLQSSNLLWFFTISRYILKPNIFMYMQIYGQLFSNVLFQSCLLQVLDHPPTPVEFMAWILKSQP